MKLTLRESMVYEARRTDLVYKEIAKKGKIDRVVLELESTDSAVMSKLAGRLKRIDDALKIMALRREELKDGWKDKKGEWHQGLRERISEYFDPADVVYTRVIDTVSFSMNLAKKVDKDPEKVTDWEAVAKELITLIDKDLEDTVNQIIAKYTEAKKVNEKAAAVRVEPIVKEGLSDAAKAIAKKISAVFSGFSKKIAHWAIDYDKKLKALDRKYKMNHSKLERETAAWLKSRAV